MYTLTFPNGQVLKFYLKSCADIFQQCWGGDITYTERYLGDTVETY